MQQVRALFRCYHRPFRQPLRTHHGLWSVRRGIIVRLCDRQHTSWGEIAPLETFGSESFEQALNFCQSLTTLNPEIIAQIPANLPACRFGLESAWEGLEACPYAAKHRPSSALLSSGVKALDEWRSLWQQGARTFKWKIAVAPLPQELVIFEKLRAALPPEAQLRLDANGGLSHEAAQIWLNYCDRYRVEFLEQPLSPAQFSQMLQLSRQYKTPIALDESVTTLDQLEHCYQAGWRGIFVIKAAIAGSPSRLRAFCQAHSLDIVWSSVLETAIAQRYIQERLIPSIAAKERAIGFGVNHWFEDGGLELEDESLWQRL